MNAPSTSMGSVKSCLSCGKVFRVPPSRKDTAKYCSASCADPHRHDGKPRLTVDVACRQCGKIFTAHCCHVRRGTAFCSRVCADLYKAKTYSERFSGKNSPNWRGGIAQHSDGYVYEKASSHPYGGSE